MNDLPKNAQYVRKDGVRLREIEAAGFLADSETQGIFHLNETGVAVWRVLENPVSADGIVDLLAAAFPDISKGQIEADVASLLDRLAAKGLVRVAA